MRAGGKTPTIAVMKSERHSRPMSAAELGELDELLAAIPEPFEPMDAATLDGFLAAILLLPEEPPMSAWLPLVFDAEGRPEAVPEGEGDLAELPDLVLRRYRDLDATLVARNPIDPIVFELEDERGRPLGGIAGVAALEPFALGFLDAAQRWPGLLDSDNEELAAALIGILRHLPEESLGDLRDTRYELDVEAPLANLDKAIEDLGTCVAEIAAITRGLTIKAAKPKPNAGASRPGPSGSKPKRGPRRP